MNYLQIDNEREIDRGKNTLFKLDVINLLQFDDLSFLKGFECHWLTFKKSKIDLAKRASTNYTE